jgi:ATP-dependent exoDNAse (exonuclease V) beta subunit
VAHTYAAQHPAEGLPELVRYLQRLLASDQKAKAPELNGQAQAVQVMTVHASKGLEFPVVIAADCRQAIRPRRRFDPFHEPEAGLVLPDDDQESPIFVERVRRARNEARCLWYVTLTRAKQRLIITTTNDRELIDGCYAKEETFFEELWNRLAADPVPGVVLEPPAPEVIDAAGDSIAPEREAAPSFSNIPAYQAALTLRDQLRARLAPRPGLAAS